MLWSHSSFRLTSSPLAGVWGSWGGWEPAPPRDTPDPRVLRGRPRLLSSSLRFLCPRLEPSPGCPVLLATASRSRAVMVQSRAGRGRSRSSYQEVVDLRE